MATLLEKLKIAREQGDQNGLQNSSKTNEDKNSSKSKTKNSSGQTSSKTETVNEPEDFTIEHVKEAFAPYASHLQNAGVGIKEALPQLLAHFDHATKNPRDFIQKTANASGIRVAMDPPAPTPPSKEEQEAFEKAQQDLMEFSQDKTPAEMQKVVPVMHALIASGVHDNLPDAYESAKWSLPENRAQQLKDLQKQADMGKSKTASKSISNNATMSLQKKETPKTFQDLAKQFRKKA